MFAVRVHSEQDAQQFRLSKFQNSIVLHTVHIYRLPHSWKKRPVATEVFSVHILQAKTLACSFRCLHMIWCQDTSKSGAWHTFSVPKQSSDPLGHTAQRCSLSERFMWSP